MGLFIAFKALSGSVVMILYTYIPRADSGHQERLLHVFDPRALHKILVEDAEYFPKELAPMRHVWISSF